MSGQLTDEDIARYERDGFVFPIDVLDAHQAKAMRAEIEAAEYQHRDDPAASAAIRFRTNFVIPSVDALTRSSAITDSVAALLGEDLLVWGCSLFSKDARSPHYVSWHQDLHYWGLSADDELTVWVALSPANTTSGCMRFLPGSQRHVVEHVDTFSSDNLLSRGQELSVEVDERDAVDAPLEPGQASLHHGRTFHASHPNRSDDRRLGLAIRYIVPGMAQQSGDKAFATLARGTDGHGNFELFAGPRGTVDSADLDVVRRALEVNHRNNYRGAAQRPEPLESSM